MGKYNVPLSAMAVKNIDRIGLHFVGGVPNLALNISSSGAKSWILRYRINGKVREMGLGPFPEVSLAEARGTALDQRALLRRGIDPIEHRWSLRRNFKPLIRSITFKQAAKQYIESHRHGWKNQKHSLQWESTLSNFAFPHIGSLDVREVSRDKILEILKPIWWTKTETATRLRGRIELILDWAKVSGYREGDNPAAWNGNLNILLPARSKVSKVKHHEALDWDKCPTFFMDLSNRRSTSSDALQFCILTATRSGEVREATWDEIDLEKCVWTIPASRIKAEREHRVPLSPLAIKILCRQPRFVGERLVFPGTGGRPLSNMTLIKLIRDSGQTFTVHGFRSSFRDWAGETTQFPREVIEHALAHQLKNKAEAAYARGDLFTKRIALMGEWADHLESRKR